MAQDGWFVCIHCLDEPGLIKFISSNATNTECSFCHAQDVVPIAAPMRLVSEHFVRCLFLEYDLAIEQLGWSGSEGGWRGSYWDAFDLACDVLEIELPRDNERLLLQHLFGVSYIDQDWCEANAYGPNDEEVAQYRWEYFCHTVRHERRFFFLALKDPDDPELPSISSVLDTIFQYAEQMNLFREVPVGTQLLRARCESESLHLETLEEMGPPPIEKANQPNRMSPAGIPMFYCCDDENTALKETASAPGYFAIGRFETLRPAVLLDLTMIPPIPSLFEPVPDGTKVFPRKALKFLHHVAQEISSPVDRGNHHAVQYVPTQVVTEFVRDQLAWGNTRVDGIKYLSSVDRGHCSYVLFATQCNVYSTDASRFGEDQWLKLTEVTHLYHGSD